ncbi:hypothetical protein BDR06DRAFT_834511, partial [Suillus hirtellus]
LVACTHHITHAWDIAAEYLFNLIMLFPSLMCDPQLLYAILDFLTLLHHEFTDEYSTMHDFHSDCTGITLQLTDDYK